MWSGVRFDEQHSGVDDICCGVPWRDTYRFGIGRRRPERGHAVQRAGDRRAGTKFIPAPPPRPRCCASCCALRPAARPPSRLPRGQRIWQRLIGAEADASVARRQLRAGEATYACLSPVLRDYARLRALPLAHDGNWPGRQVIPAPWIMDATTVREDQPHLRPGAGHPGLRLRLPDVDPARPSVGCSCSGASGGRRIYVDPQSELVMESTAVHKLPVDLPPLEGDGRAVVRLISRAGAGVSRR